MAAMTTPIPQAIVRMAGKPKVTDFMTEVKRPLWPTSLLVMLVDPHSERRVVKKVPDAIVLVTTPFRRAFRVVPPNGV